MIRVGQKVRFDAFETHKFASERLQANVIGTVVYINEQHKWFSAEYGETKQRISFKFSQIGQNVRLCK